MMNMLRVAGVPIYCDAHNLGKSCETKQMLGLPDDWEWLKDVTGAVKILHPTTHVPPMGLEYVFIHMVRNPVEQAKSGAKLLLRSAGQVVDVTDSARKIREKREQARRILKVRGEVIEVRFEDQIRGRIERVADQLDLNPDVMRSLIVPRGPECYDGFIEAA